MKICLAIRKVYVDICITNRFRHYCIGSLSWDISCHRLYLAIEFTELGAHASTGICRHINITISYIISSSGLVNILSSCSILYKIIHTTMTGGQRLGCSAPTPWYMCLRVPVSQLGAHCAYDASSMYSTNVTLKKETTLFIMNDQ